MKLPKYHGLGNDYFLWNPRQASRQLTPAIVRGICDRHFGAGADGILEGPYLPDSAPLRDICRSAGVKSHLPPFAVKIWNPDGSEAEKSGNGARIFTQYLLDQGLIRQNSPVTFATRGGIVTATVLTPFQAIQCNMGTAVFQHRDFPLLAKDAGKAPLLIRTLELEGRTLQFCPVNIGNPHCVVLNADVSPETARRLGPLLENHPAFPNRINVQFLQTMDPHNIQIEIWERGAGYTLASGTSSCAAAAAAIRCCGCVSPVQVHAPGGILTIQYDNNWHATLTGPVAFVYTADIPLPDIP